MAESGDIQRLDLISSKAYCSIFHPNNQAEMSSVEIKNPIMGTMFYWEIPFKNLQKGR